MVVAFGPMVFLVKDTPEVIPADLILQEREEMVEKNESSA